MSIPETKTGGSREAFPETVWSSVLGRLPADSPERRAALDDLCSRYWRPVYRALRAAHGRSIEDAKDLTQAFFCFVVESDLVSKYEPDRGRFRTFLKAALGTFLAGIQRDAGRLKRGGGRANVPLDVGAAEAAGLPEDARQGSPDEIFDRLWAADMIEGALVELRRRLVAEGKEAYFKVYEKADLAGTADGRSSYDDIARELDLSTGDVRNFLHQARVRFRDILRAAVADSVASPEDLDRELKDLFH